MQPGGFEPILSGLLSYGILLAGLGAAMASAYIVISTYSALPHWDEWSVFDHLATGKMWSWAWLWAQHNEHRILIPKVFFLLDVRLFHGTQTFLLVSIFLVQLLLASLLSGSLWILGGMRDSAWRTGSGLIAYCILCPTQYENLVWGFQLQFVIPAAMAALAILSLLLFYRDVGEPGEPRRWLPLLAMAAATVATWSLSNGMLLWPLLLFTTLLLRMRYSTVAAFLIGGAANMGWYFFHYHRPTPASAVEPGLQWLGGILQYVAVYFGSTFVRHSGGPVAVMVGAIGLCLGLAMVGRVLRQRGAGSLLMLELSLLMLLCLATATITAVGRLYLGVEQASASRYQTFALVFWCSLGLGLLFYASKFSPLRRHAVSAVLLLAMVGFASQARWPLIDAQWHQWRLQRISLALLAGVHDPITLAEAYPDSRVVWRDAEYMKQNRLSIFAGELYSQLGQPVEARYHLHPAGDCSGYISDFQVLAADYGEGVRLDGVVWERAAMSPGGEIIAVVDGRIAGFGSDGTVGYFRHRAHRGASPRRFDWVAFVGKLNPATKIEVYAVVGKDGTGACPLAEISPLQLVKP